MSERGKVSMLEREASRWYGVWLAMQVSGASGGTGNEPALEVWQLVARCRRRIDGAKIPSHRLFFSFRFSSLLACFLETLFKKSS